MQATWQTHSWRWWEKEHRRMTVVHQGMRESLIKRQGRYYFFLFSAHFSSYLNALIGSSFIILLFIIDMLSICWFSNLYLLLFSIIQILDSCFQLPAVHFAWLSHCTPASQNRSLSFSFLIIHSGAEARNRSISLTSLSLRDSIYSISYKI